MAFLVQHLCQVRGDYPPKTLVLGADPHPLILDCPAQGGVVVTVPRIDQKPATLAGDRQALLALLDQCLVLEGMRSHYHAGSPSPEFSPVDVAATAPEPATSFVTLPTATSLRSKIFALLRQALQVVLVTFALAEPGVAHALECVLRRGGLVEVWTGFPAQAFYHKQRTLLERLTAWPTFHWQEVPGLHDKVLLTDQGVLFMSANMTAHGLYRGSESGVWLACGLPEVARNTALLRKKLSRRQVQARRKATQLGVL